MRATLTSFSAYPAPSASLPASPLQKFGAGWRPTDFTVEQALENLGVVPDTISQDSVRDWADRYNAGTREVGKRIYIRTPGGKNLFRHAVGDANLITLAQLNEALAQVDPNSDLAYAFNRPPIEMWDVLPSAYEDVEHFIRFVPLDDLLQEISQTNERGFETLKQAVQLLLDARRY